MDNGWLVYSFLLKSPDEGEERNYLPPNMTHVSPVFMHSRSDDLFLSYKGKIKKYQPLILTWKGIVKKLARVSPCLVLKS